MITARNFAAQAERGLRQFAQQPRYKGLWETQNFCDACAAHITNATHFVLPDGGRIFNDGLKGLEGMSLRLPFPTITIELCPTEKRKMVILAYQDGKDIMVTYVVPDWVNGDYWRPLPVTARLPSLDPFSPDDFKRSNLEYMISDAKQWAEFQPAAQDKLLHECYSSCTTILELLEALSCRNVSLDNYQEASPVNAKRIRDGKLPIYETKVLVIDAGAEVSGTRAIGGGSHASPRQHLRRGHIRRLPSGNIWVNSCIVGDASKGVIAKTYQINPPRAMAS